MDTYIKETPRLGLTAMGSEYDPKPSITVSGGAIAEMDGKRRDEFDMFDRFIADYEIDISVCEKAMNISSEQYADMLIDANADKSELLRLARGLTPAKLTEIAESLDVIYLLTAIRNLRTDKGRQVSLIKGEKPIRVAEDAAEAAASGFSVSQLDGGNPVLTLALYVGARVGGAYINGALAPRDTLAMHELLSTAYLAPLYGTDKAVLAEGTTPYAEMFLSAVYASRGLKTAAPAGVGGALAKGGTEGRSMLYLAARSLLAIKGMGADGVLTGGAERMALAAALPSGMRAALAANLIARMLGLSCVSDADAQFTESEIRSAANMLIQMLPQSNDMVVSYPPKCGHYELAHDFNSDGAVAVLAEEERLRVRNCASKAVCAVFDALGISTDTGALPEHIDSEQIDALIKPFMVDVRSSGNSPLDELDPQSLI